MLPRVKHPGPQRQLQPGRHHSQQGSVAVEVPFHPHVSCESGRAGRLRIEGGAQSKA